MSKAKEAKLKELGGLCRSRLEAGKSVVVHIVYQRNGLRAKCRLWTYDGEIVASADGGGFDREGVLLGEVLELIYGDKLDTLPMPVRNARGYYDRDQLYGLYRGINGKAYLQGGCGWDSMVKIAAALGLKVSSVDTSKYSTLLTIERNSTS